MPNRSEKAAEIMLGKGWYTGAMLSEEMGITTYVASQTIQAVRRSPKFETEEEKRNGRVVVKVTRIHSKMSQFNRDQALVRAVIFGEPLPKEVSA